MCTPQGCCHPLHTLLRVLTLLFKNMVTGVCNEPDVSLSTGEPEWPSDQGRRHWQCGVGRAEWAIGAAGGLGGLEPVVVSLDSDIRGRRLLFQLCLQFPGLSSQALCGLPTGACPSTFEQLSGSSPLTLRSSPGVFIVDVSGKITATSSWVISTRSHAHTCHTHTHTCSRRPSLSFSHSLSSLSLHQVTVCLKRNTRKKGPVLKCTDECHLSGLFPDSRMGCAVSFLRLSYVEMLP